MTLHDPFNQSKMPAEFADRETRAALIGQVALELMARGGEANLFVGGALIAWLENGGNLQRDYLKVVKRQSRVTVSVLWRRVKARHSE